MNKQTVNDTFSLQIPDSFEPVSAEELHSLSRSSDPYRWGVRDRENRRMILVLWKQYPALLVRIAGLKTIVSRNEQLTRKVYEGHDYRLLGFSSLQAGDEEAEGYRFSYSTEGVTQVMNSFLVKDGSTVYSFLCCGREENADADQETFRQILGSLQYI